MAQSTSYLPCVQICSLVFSYQEEKKCLYNLGFSLWIKAVKTRKGSMARMKSLPCEKEASEDQIRPSYFEQK